MTGRAICARPMPLSDNWLQSQQGSSERHQPSIASVAKTVAELLEAEPVSPPVARRSETFPDIKAALNCDNQTYHDVVGVTQPRPCRRGCVTSLRPRDGGR